MPNTATTDDLYRVLMSIDATLRELLALSKSKRAATPAPTVAERFGVQEPVVIDAADLDSQYGDEVIRFDPRDWTGTRSYKGCRMSECEPAYLDSIARVFSDLAKKNDLEGKEYKGVAQSTYDTRSARRARAWAARLRAGWKPQATAAMNTDSIQW